MSNKKGNHRKSIKIIKEELIEYKKMKILDNLIIGPMPLARETDTFLKIKKRIQNEKKEK
jgi:hypothetical protein